MTRWQRWRALPPPERALAWRLLLLLPLIDVSLRLMGFQRTWSWLARCAPAPGVVRVAADVAPVRLAWLTRAVGARSPWPTTCLRQALALWCLLRRRGHPARLKIGVIRRIAPFQAHAWVELDGSALDPEVAAGAMFPPLAEP